MTLSRIAVTGKWQMSFCTYVASRWQAGSNHGRMAVMDKNEDKARQILRRVERESDGAQFGGKGVDNSDDPVEIWGTRIGRGLGLLITIFLLLAFIVWFGATLQ
jgi:hypothetical protein